MAGGSLLRFDRRLDRKVEEALRRHQILQGVLIVWRTCGSCFDLQAPRRSNPGSQTENVMPRGNTHRAPSVVGGEGASSCGRSRRFGSAVPYRQPAFGTKQPQLRPVVQSGHEVSSRPRSACIRSLWPSGVGRPTNQIQSVFGAVVFHALVPSRSDARVPGHAGRRRRRWISREVG
jgi:hypothetical protein